MDGKPRQIKLDDLHYYFDSREKDALDHGARSRKSREVLALRDRLLTLSDREFEMAIKTLHNMIDGEKLRQENQDKPNKDDAEALFQQTSRS